LPVVALVILVVTLIPAETWKAPADDAVYNGFDPNLIYVSQRGGGAAQVSATSIDMTAGSGSNPSVILATTPMPKLNASMDALVLDNTGGGQPLRIGVWSPWTGAGQFVVFGPAPADLITAETIIVGGVGPTLVGGPVAGSTVLGTYRVGVPYQVTISIDKTNDRITTGVTGSDGVKAATSVDSQRLPTIFGNHQLSLTASTSGGTGASHAILRNYTLTLPHQRWWASEIDDPVAHFVLICLAIASVLLLGLAVAGRFGSGFTSMVSTLRGWRVHGTARRGLILAIGSGGLYLAGNALLFPLGGHPFDIGSAKVYAYVARAYGPAQLYYLPNLVSVAKIWNGFPYIEAAFPYGPVTVYLSAAIGWLSSVLLAGGGLFSPNAFQLEYVIKAANVLFGLGDAALIYLILSHLRVGVRWSLIGAALFLFNPAVWFSMSVWGQTHVFSLFFVLAAVLFAEKRLPLWAWLALAAACLTRPQMLVFGLLVGIVFLRKFTWRENLVALSWTIVVSFLVMLPLTLATSPSLPVDITFNNFRVQEAGGNDPQLTTVSQGAYSIWPLITYVAQGASGLQRVFTSSSTQLVGGLTYQRVSQIVTLASVLIVSAALVLRKRARVEPGAYLPLVTVGIASFLMLLTGVLATHFLLALPFFLLCRPWMNTPAYLYTVAIWTVTTLVTMFGDMGILMASAANPLPLASSAITHFFVGLYSSDRFITVGVIANLCALIWLAVLTFRQGAPVTPARPQAA
jgi:hypothetical protein